MQEVKYGHKNTYRFELDKDRLDWLTKQTNRSTGQTQFLFQLVDGNFRKLKKLEVKIKNNSLFYCPADKSSVKEVLRMKSKNDFFTIGNYSLLKFKQITRNFMNFFKSLFKKNTNV
jgi:hypothetical protein